MANFLSNPVDRSIDYIKLVIMLNNGEKVENRYTVLKTLGRGGMSIVYLVEDNRLDHVWVLKEFSLEESDEEDRKALEDHFITEAKLCAKLSHPGIPRVIDFFSIDSRHFLVEEYVEGDTLLSKLESQSFGVEEAISCTLQICAVLEYIHSLNIVYRDVKPDNIMIRSDGTLKLIDFGIARVYKSGQVKDTIIIGTPGYAAPEQYGTAQTDARSDIYSLGALMHHMLTGRDPREKPFVFELPSKHGVDIPPEIEKVIMTALALKAEDRYETIASFRKDLESAIKNSAWRKYLPASSFTSPENGSVNGKQNSENGENSSGAELQRVVTEKYQGKKANSSSGEKTKKITDTGSERNSEIQKSPGEEGEQNPLAKIMILVYAVLFIMFFTLLFEIRFKVWILIPYVFVAWILVIIFLKIRGK